MSKVLIFVLGFVFFPVTLWVVGYMATRKWSKKEMDTYLNAYNDFIGTMDDVYDGRFREE